MRLKMSVKNGVPMIKLFSLNVEKEKSVEDVGTKNY
jgi:hypothetical protein